jgi:ATP:ADP antiporter, AAA family
MERALTLLRKAVDVHPNEVRALLLACVFNFVILGSYYVIRPIRDDIAAAGGVENLSWMFTGTLVVTLLANTAFSAIVARMPRRKFLPIGYRFLIANLIIFYFLMRTVPPTQNVWVGRVFFVWVSVFNLFIVTLFWAFMTDLFDSEQAKRLFAFIAVGGQLGAIAGPLFTASLVQRIGTPNLLLVAAAGLELAPWCVKFFPAVSPAPARNPNPNPNPNPDPDPDPDPDRPLSELEQGQEKEKGAEQPIGGGIMTAFTHVARSPYLLGICLFMVLYAITSTFVYFQQADITRQHFHDRAARTAFFAQLDLAVNTLTIFGQLLITGRLLKWFGVGVTLAFLPLLSLFGFVGMGLMPVLGLLALLQVMRRAGNFAITRPAREVLFTVLRREDKYKAKSFIDTFVYRTGDQIGAWSYTFLTWLGLGLTGISFVAAPLAAIWCGLSIWLGRKQAVLAQSRSG